MDIIPCLGAQYLGEGATSFLVWAPNASTLDVRIVSPQPHTVRAEKCDEGYFSAVLKGVLPGASYFYELNGKLERSDPASRLQAEGVHGPSTVIDPNFTWTDQQWRGLPLRDYIIYELHVGTFTPQGTFDAIIPHLPSLVDLGISAIELMPVAQFPGARNWGYDGVYPFAVQNSYGGPLALKRLVNACHEAGLAVILDVVYNHLGPEGNYLRDFGPYFTSCYKTGWGDALNFDGEYSDHVRRFFIENSLHWQRDFHMDALRLDAIHAIRDFSAKPFLLELADETRRASASLGRQFHLIAESDLNDPRVCQPSALGGLGLDAQWADDFHHCLHVLLTGEREGYYMDFGGTRQLAKIFRNGFAYTGDYSEFRKRRYGARATLSHSRQFVVFSQNHDQVGNRMLGERLSHLTSPEAARLAAAVVILSPFIPLLFMGEEYGEPAPFLYVTSHGEEKLVEAVRAGRNAEFAAFKWLGEVPDPQSEETFSKSKIDVRLSAQPSAHWELRLFYKELIRLRKELPAIAQSDSQRAETMAYEHPNVLLVRYWTEQDEAVALFCFERTAVSAPIDLPSGKWSVVLSSAQWTQGSRAEGELKSDGRVTLALQPLSVTLFHRVTSRARDEQSL
jgi:maltooligosyltrehalose trehalohydrolase